MTIQKEVNKEAIVLRTTDESDRETIFAISRGVPMVEFSEIWGEQFDEPDHAEHIHLRTSPNDEVLAMRAQREGVDIGESSTVMSLPLETRLQLLGDKVTSLVIHGDEVLPLVDIMRSAEFIASSEDKPELPIEPEVFGRAAMRLYAGEASLSQAA